jgi:hypothetical protein
MFIRRSLIRTVLLVSVTAVGSLAIWSHLHEPRAEGKPISYWIHQLRIGVKVLRSPNGTFNIFLPNLSDDELARLMISTNVRTMGEGWACTFTLPNWPDRFDLWRFEDLKADPAARVIKGMGPSALPYLKAGLHRRESPAENLFCRWVWPRLPARLQRWMGIPMHPIHMRANSAYALGLLGASALPLVPELRGVVANDGDYLVRSVAREALHRIDPELADGCYAGLFEQQVVPNGPPNHDTSSSNLFSPKLSL